MTTSLSLPRFVEPASHLTYWEDDWVCIEPCGHRHFEERIHFNSFNNTLLFALAQLLLRHLLKNIVWSNFHIGHRHTDTHINILQ